MAKEKQQDIRKRANRYFISKIIVNSLLVIIGAILIGLFLHNMQQKAAIARQTEDSNTILTDIVETLESNAQDAQDLTLIYHEENQSMLSDLGELLNKGLYDTLCTVSTDECAEILWDIVDRSGASYLFIMDSSGTITMSPELRYFDMSLLESGMMSAENISILAGGTRAEDGSITPVIEENTIGSYYFYSQQIRDLPYYVVIGADTSDIELQLASLKDTTRVLSQAAFNNDGFLFSADPQTHTFLYYENGSEVLTGQDTLEAGLSLDAFNNGFTAMETINGVEYFCVSRSFGDHTIICAVAATENIYDSDKYVLFWSISGFVLMMLLCIAYAIIVRNDFVAKHTETDKVVLHKGKTREHDVIFNRTVARKILPLLLASTLMVFGISFYTQTLLEISDAAEDCAIAIDDVSSHYTESTITRSAVINYYNNSYLAKANLIAYLLEEDVSALNEATAFTHTEYDEKNVKHVLTDDEGNPLRSVRYSSSLIKLCENNTLDSIYVYDENGRTIATSTDAWYFRLSHDENSQSYPFLTVLDGKTDYLIQEAMTDDLGVTSQYIGTAFNYYTTKDTSGNTVYVTRFDYESSLQPEYTGNPVTKHRSLIQIGLPGKIAAKLLMTTDLSYIFSADTLSNGAIMLFDDSDEHRVLYSPYTSSINKTAAEVGVSEKAFTDEYYGFQKINGIEYFQRYSFAETPNGNYYISAAIPSSSMYTARLPIALITAGVSFLLILILSATVTLTTEDEERLYLAVSAKFRNIRNSPVFNIRTASGKTSSTVSAKARWDNSSIPWKEKSPEQKLLVLIGIVISVLILYIALALVGLRTYFSDTSIITYILSNNWDRGMNIFALSSAFLVLVMTAIGVTLFRIPIRLMTSILGTRSETIGHLLLSILKYGGVLASLFYCLYLLGLDASSLLASVGILSLVIGLGAQSLIKDIIAGIFIVFEGEFRVGDIVTISNTRGTIVDIGLRTTKILVPGGNIKIYNNSEISGVLNMTKQESVAVCNIGIEYGQDINYVEEVLNRELPHIRKRNKNVLDGPFFKGVSALNDSSVELLIIAMCAEADIKDVTRLLNREILEIFYRNNINVPFPQVTVSQRQEVINPEIVEEKPKEAQESSADDETIPPENGEDGVK